MLPNLKINTDFTNYVQYHPIFKGISFTNFVYKIEVISMLCIITNHCLNFSQPFPRMSLHFVPLANV
jgi:hypothetical protein